jgi:hypothetical protein
MRFVYEGNLYRRRLEVIEPLRWEMNVSFTEIANLFFRGTNVLYATTICNVSFQ